jgi:hypothetical protein
MLLYTPESNIELSMTNLHVQFGVPLKHSTIFSIHKPPIHKMKLTLVLVLCRYVLNNLGVPNCSMLVHSLCGVWTLSVAAVWSLF